MSHFTVAVIAKDSQELEARLQPYHEYECTGIEDKYVQWIPEPFLKSLKNYWKYYIRKRDFRGFSKFMKDWNGADRRGLWFYRLTNPNAKWDWWIVGGRWTGSLIAKDGIEGIRGKPGLMTAPAERNRFDSMLVKDIDFGAMGDWKPYAVIDKAGRWNGKGTMGWFGCSYDETDDWNIAFKAWRDNLLPEDRIWIVDCHI